jgi:sulfatase maturation enzyme AslB (radical SAM superfamily)
VIAEYKIKNYPLFHSIQRHFAAHTLFDLSTLKRIRFVGGEPMMEQKRLIEILHDIKSAQRGTLSHLTVSMQTNGTVRFNDELAALLSECGAFELTISIDGLDTVNDYQRTGYDWDRLEQNLQYFNDTDFCANTRKQMDTTLTLLNINNYIKLYFWISHVLPNFNKHLTCITYPNELRICNIPHEYKQILKSRFLTWNGPRVKIILAELDIPCMIPIEQIQKRIIELDLLRGEDFANVDPEMYAAIFP